ncbi:MAG: tripartite tricarboxylate transporter substrate binding protein [Burkholderiaceae bacterium]
MPYRFNSTAVAAIAFAASCASAPAALAQEAWPSRPITFVVTYPPGGNADMVGRLVAPRMSEALGQPIVVENKAGGAGQVGAAFVARSKPDGYTVMIDGGGYAINPSLFPQLSYDPAKAFTPIGILGLFPLAIVVTPSYGAKTAAELVEMAKAAPNGISYASPGTGSSQHLAGALFLQQSKVTMVHVPYKGGGPAMADVMGGHVPVFIANLASSLAHIKSGKLRPLAVMASQRSSVLPDVPTLAEAGVANAEAYEWNGMFVPAGVPPAIVARLTDALKKALDSPDVKEKIASVGGEPFPGGAPEAQKFIREQTERMAQVIREGNIRAE